MPGRTLSQRRGTRGTQQMGGFFTSGVRRIGMKKERAEAFNMESIDKRMIELKLKKGDMTEKYLAKHLSTLPDLASQAEEIPADLDRKRPAKELGRMDRIIDSHAHLEMSAFDRDRDQVIGEGEGGRRGDHRHGGDYRGGLPEGPRDHPPLPRRLCRHRHTPPRGEGHRRRHLRLAQGDGEARESGRLRRDRPRFLPEPLAPGTQILRFGEQLELASELNLPVVIHDRDAHRETMDLLKGWKGAGGASSTASPATTRWRSNASSMGFYISIPGTVTFEKSEKLRSIVRELPLETLLVETDCPYLTPNPFRGKRNEPAHVVHTARKIAEIEGKPFSGRCDDGRNAKRIFNITHERSV
ncbi:MAG: TatD family hydrolase [Desulfosudis oleivorans]|nr:TatD family hydrolase [Desulfosudis oleivorans]